MGTLKHAVKRSLTPPSHHQRTASPILIGRNVQFAPRETFGAGYSPVHESQLYSTGLRGRCLIFVVCVIAVLWMLAVITLACNILLMHILGMDHRGMKCMQFVDSPDGDTTVRFLADDVHLGTIVSNNGVVAGYNATLFNITAARILLRTKVMIDGKLVASDLILEDGRIRLEGVENLIIAERETLRPLFSAMNPDVSIGSNVKKLASRQIVTNKVRAPLDKDLNFEVENMIFRGNEGNNFTARNVAFRAKNGISLTSSSNGAIRLGGKTGVILGGVSNLAISPSPSLEANIVAYRLCICESSDRLFLVAGNELCSMPDAYCY